jgi:hypothetical protein
MTKESYKSQTEEFPEVLEKSCGQCEEASTYNEDRQCWCNKHEMEVCESTGICDAFERAI